LAADLQIHIHPTPSEGTVMLETIAGVDYGPNDPLTTIHTERAVILTKAEARAIASALMGCAAEI
jgi:hypothetical protein